MDPRFVESPTPVRALVRPESVHRDAYISAEVFQLEQRRFFAATWIFAAHASQLREPGDFVTLEVAGQPLLVIRQADGTIAVLHNRCAHKGTMLFTASAGNAGRNLRCPYHAWTYRLDGSALAVPLKAGYEGTGMRESHAGAGLARVPHVEVYRDFVFVRLSDQGPSFGEYFGEALQWLDNMAERSPTGQLEVAGGVIRNVIRCNWKIYLENINDTVHPVSTHESAGNAAKGVWSAQAAQGPAPMAVEQLLPFASGYDFFDKMDAMVYPNGHSALGVSFSTHSSYQVPPDYEAAMTQAYGGRAKEILGRAPQNSVLYPSLSVKSSPLAIRVIRPLAADRTLVEAWSFRAVGAPDLLLQRALTYNRLVFSPMSILAHDDIHLFESIQNGLRSNANEWVSLHRGYEPGELVGNAAIRCKGTSELLMRNQFRAWDQRMCAGERA
jgi:phenylpropionate dioxygenase-like ring-hydroxylating dioxygenase large terminal subunit